MPTLLENGSCLDAPNPHPRVHRGDSGCCVPILFIQSSATPGNTTSFCLKERKRGKKRGKKVVRERGMHWGMSVPDHSYRQSCSGRASTPTSPPNLCQELSNSIWSVPEANVKGPRARPGKAEPGSAFQKHLDNALELLGSLEGLRLLGWMVSVGCSGPQACP